MARGVVMLATVERYLASLPGGLSAYPACVHKGEPLAVWLRRSPTAKLAAQLPPAVASLLGPADDLPEWVPEVHANVVYLALREAFFPSDEAFLQHARATNRAVLQTPTNRVLFWVAAPRAILRAAGLRWGALHRGSTVDVRITSDVSARVVLRYPRNLFPETVLRGTATGFAVAIENAGGRDVQLVLKSTDEESALFEGRWK